MFPRGSLVPVIKELLISLVLPLFKVTAMDNRHKMVTEMLRFSPTFS
jgi:hypothetical protein